MAHQFRFGLLLLPLFALGCPDTEARFKEFEDATKDQRPTADDDESESESESEESAGTDTGMEGLPDMSGIYLAAIETALGPDTPLQFVATIDMTVNDDGTGVMNLTFEPLSLDMGSQIAPRECLGDSLTYNDVQIDANGEWEIDMGLTMVSGAANPVTGSDIEATLVLHGHIVHVDAMCGDITGMLMSPLMYDLAGSTFGMLRLADTGCDPSSLPGMGEFPYRCSQVPPAPAGDGDGDTSTDTGTDSGTDTSTT